MKKKLQGKVAFITGGSRGIGAAIAKRLASEGADVAFTHSGKKSVPAEAVLATIKESGVKTMAIVADNRNMQALEEAMQSTISTLGSIDILVNNAGIFHVKPIDEIAPQEYDDFMAVNVKAVFSAIQFAARHMKAGGRIITIGSNISERAAFPGFSLYGMSKSALSGLTKGVARDLGSTGITVNLIHPGPVATDMNPDEGEKAEFIKSYTAVKRYGKADEIAELATYLASEEAGFITGTAITIDGGFNI